MAGLLCWCVGVTTLHGTHALHGTRLHAPVQLRIGLQPHSVRRARLVLTSASTNAVNAQPEQDAKARVPRVASFAALMAFFGPCLASSLTSEVMSVVDTSVVGRFGSTLELASLAPAALIADNCVYTFSFLSIATMSLVAFALARGQNAQGFETASNAQFLAAATGLVIATLVHLKACPLLKLVLGKSATPAIVAAALSYLRVRLFGIPFALVSMVSQSALQASKDPLSPLLAVAGGGILNLVLDVVACIYLRMGIVGAAIATLASQVVQCALLVLALYRRQRKLSPESPVSILKPPSAAVLRGFVKFAGPLFFVILGKSFCYNMMTVAASSSGVLALAAHQVLTTIFYMSCKVGDSISQTAQAFLPASLSDDGETTEATNSLANKLAAQATACGLVTAAVASSVASRGGALFTPDPSVLAMIAGASPFVFAGLSIHSLTMFGEGRPARRAAVRLPPSLQSRKQCASRVRRACSWIRCVLPCQAAHCLTCLARRVVQVCSLRSAISTISWAAMQSTSSCSSPACSS